MLVIRAAQPLDGADLMRIDLATWTPDVSPAAAPDPGTAFFGDRREPGDVIVAELEGQVVGYAMLHQAIPIPSHQHVLELNGIAVDPARQGRGIGRQLVEAACEEARRRGSRKLSLRVLAPNGGARRLYESCGFVVEGVLEGEFLLGGRLVDDVLMARLL